MSTIKLYRHALSGHSHRAELFLSLLNKRLSSWSMSTWSTAPTSSPSSSP